MKIDLTKTLNTLKGEPLKDDEGNITLGKALSNILLMSQEGGKMKLFVLAKKFYEQKAIDLDESDFALVKGVVAKSNAYTGSLIGGQIELMFSELKEEK